MNTLYDITAQYKQVLEKFLDTVDEEGVVDEEIYALLCKTQDALETKAKNCAAMYLELDSEIKRIEKFEEKIKARKNKLEKRKEWLKGYVDRNLTSAGIEKIEGDYLTVSYRTSERVEIDNEAEIPDEYWRVKKEPDKVAIKQAIKQGKQIGAHLEPTRSIQIT